MFEKFENPKLAKKATVIFLAFLMFVGVVYAGFYIYSSFVNVPITTITVSLSASPSSVIQNHNVTLTATLYKNGVIWSDADGRIVEFGIGTGASDWQWIGNSTTTAGVATFEYNVTQSNSINFVARYWVA